MCWLEPGRSTSDPRVDRRLNNSTGDKVNAAALDGYEEPSERH